MNAGVLADGLRRGGASQAQLALHQYWKDVGHLPGYGTLWPLAPQRTWHLDHNPIYLWGDMLTRVWSLYHLCRHHGIAMAMPSSWRSRRTSVSKAAKTAGMPKNARPAALEVSTLCSMTLRCAPACSISWGLCLAKCVQLSRLRWRPRQSVDREVAGRNDSKREHSPAPAG